MGGAVVGKLVVLVGFSGAGKTTVGRILQEKFGLWWVDIDAQVEQEAGRSIATIIRVEGEQRFRDLEREAICNAVAECSGMERRGALSLGGGALLNPDTKRLLKENGFLVWLEVSAETAARRVYAEEAAETARSGEARRPLLAAKNEPGAKEVHSVKASNEDTSDRPSLDRVLIEVKKLMEKRRGLYEISDYRIVTDNMSPEEVAENIMQRVGRNN